jgi:hypothetical protein
MGNVLADLKRASSTMFSSPGSKIPPANSSDGPPRVQHRHPDDELSPGARTDSSSLKSTTPHEMQGMKPDALYHQIQIDPEEGEFNLAEKVDNERAREVHQQSHAMEVVRLANEETEKRLAAEEEAASSEDAAKRRGFLEKRLAEEEAAAAEEAANRSLHLKPMTIVNSKKSTSSDESVTIESYHRHPTMEGDEAKNNMQQQSHAYEKVTPEPLTSGVNDSTASSSQNRTPDPIKSRREMLLARRERARSRQPPSRLSSSPKRTTTSSSAATAAIPTTAPPATTTTTTTTTTATPNQEAEAHKPSNTSSSHATTSTAAMARERYARHKKMLQQRKG